MVSDNITENYAKLAMLKVAVDVVSEALRKIKEEYGEVTEEEKLRAAEFFRSLLKSVEFKDEEIHTEWIEYFE